MQVPASFCACGINLLRGSFGGFDQFPKLGIFLKGLVLGGLHGNINPKTADARR
jgi:hypothetical protein